MNQQALESSERRTINQGLDDPEINPGGLREEQENTNTGIQLQIARSNSLRLSQSVEFSGMENYSVINEEEPSATNKLSISHIGRVGYNSNKN